MKKKSIVKSLNIAFDESNLVNYKDIKDKIEPFDLIACRGGDILSDFIEILESKQVGMGKFTHVGMIVNSDILPKCKVEKHDFYLEENKLYILESTFSYTIDGIIDNIPDVSTNKGKFGVQLRDFEALIPHYIMNDKTKVAWCKLKNNPYSKTENDTKESLIERRMLLQSIFVPFFNDYHDRLYEIDALGLFGAMFPSLRLLRDNRDKIYKKLYKKLNRYHITENKGPGGWQFCSELVANVYLLIGILDKNVNPKNVLPIDFFGYDEDNIQALVESPIFIRDW